MPLFAPQFVVFFSLLILLVLFLVYVTIHSSRPFYHGVSLKSVAKLSQF